MSGHSWELEGMNELLHNLDVAERHINSGVNKSLREGGKVLQKAIVANTPLGTGARAAQHGKHAKDDVQVSSVRTESGTAYKHLFVGYGPSSYWYMWFLEEGTYSKGNPMGIRPRKHTLKAFNSAQSQTQSVMANELAEVVRGVSG